MADNARTRMKTLGGYDCSPVSKASKVSQSYRKHAGQEKHTFMTPWKQDNGPRSSLSITSLVTTLEITLFRFNRSRIEDQLNWKRRAAITAEDPFAPLALIPGRTSIRASKLAVSMPRMQCSCTASLQVFLERRILLTFQKVGLGSRLVRKSGLGPADRSKE